MIVGVRAIHRPARTRPGFRPFAPANAASQRGLREAVAALHGEGAPLVGDDAIAAMEQRRCDVERVSARQPGLPLETPRA